MKLDSVEHNLIATSVKHFYQKKGSSQWLSQMTSHFKKNIRGTSDKCDAPVLTHDARD